MAGLGPEQLKGLRMVSIPLPHPHQFTAPSFSGLASPAVEVPTFACPQENSTSQVMWPGADLLQPQTWDRLGQKGTSMWRCLLQSWGEGTLRAVQVQDTVTGTQHGVCTPACLSCVYPSSTVREAHPSRFPASPSSPGGGPSHRAPPQPSQHVLPTLTAADQALGSAPACRAPCRASPPQVTSV